MHARNLTLTADFSYIPAQNDDGWSFHLPELGFTLYATSPEEGKKVLDRALSTLLRAFQDTEHMTSYLDARGVVYRNGNSSCCNYATTN